MITQATKHVAKLAFVASSGTSIRHANVLSRCLQSHFRFVFDLLPNLLWCISSYIAPVFLIYTMFVSIYIFCLIQVLELN